MKLPLWSYNKKTGKYDNFPYHLLKTYPDGKLGVDWPVFLNDRTGHSGLLVKYGNKFVVDYGTRGQPVRYLLIE